MAQQQHAARAPGHAPRALLDPLTCPTGTNIMAVSGGAELSIAVVEPGKTYELELGAGIYTINQTMQLSTATTTCFRGKSRASVTILVDTNDTSNSGRAFSVSAGAQLGLFSLVLDGQGTAPGVSVDGATLQADDVTFQRLRLSQLGGQGGAAVAACYAAQVSITGSDLLDNTCDGCFGGALELVDSDAELQEVCEHDTAVCGNGPCSLQEGTHRLAGCCWLDAGQVVAQHGAIWWRCRHGQHKHAGYQGTRQDRAEQHSGLSRRGLLHRRLEHAGHRGQAVRQRQPCIV